MDTNIGETVRLRGECSQLHRENTALRATVLALHSEVYGARYLFAINQICTISDILQMFFKFQISR